MRDIMGRWGYKTYESDYIEDLLDDFGLIQDFREGKPLTLEEVREILEGEDSEEVYLGIVSFLLDEWKSPDELIPKKCLETALKYAEKSLNNYSEAKRWVEGWNDRIEALEEEMEAIEKILNPTVPFDFSKYKKIDQDVFFELNNWEKFDESDKFALINYLSKYPNLKAINILKREISAYLEKNDSNAKDHLVLAGLALSQLEGEDAIDIILENSHDLTHSLDKERVEGYLKIRLMDETDSHLCKKIETTIEGLHQEYFK